MDWDKGPTLVRVMTGEAVLGGGQGAREKTQNLLLSFCCEPKTALKNKVCFSKKG